MPMRCCFLTLERKMYSHEHKITDKNTVAIFGAPRSGSTFAFHNLVTGLIREHPGYNTEFNRQRRGGEPFRDTVWAGNSLEDNWRDFPDDYWIGKFHLLDLINADKAGFVNDLLDNTGYKILLLRRNLWEGSLSMAISSAKNQWINNLDHQPIELDPVHFRDMLELQLRNVNHMWGDNDWNIRYDQFCYTEELTDNPSQWYQRATGKWMDHIENHIEKSPPKEQIITNLAEMREIYEQHPKVIRGGEVEGDIINYRLPEGSQQYIVTYCRGDLGNHFLWFVNQHFGYDSQLTDTPDPNWIWDPQRDSWQQHTFGKSVRKFASKLTKSQALWGLTDREQHVTGLVLNLVWDNTDTQAVDYFTHRYAHLDYGEVFRNNNTRRLQARQQSSLDIVDIDVYRLLVLADINEYSRLLSILGIPGRSDWRQMVDTIQAHGLDE